MSYQTLLTSFIQGWEFTRSETLEILSSLDDEKLSFKPEGDKWQPLFAQFGCIGRTQLVYAQAVKTGTMDFSFFYSPTLPQKTENTTKEQIQALLEKANTVWIDAVNAQKDNEDYSVTWNDFSMPLIKHIASLGEHERLHHGQFISYFTFAGFTLPAEFKNNWKL